MSTGGFIKIWRDWRKNPLLDTPVRRDIWLWLIETACWRPRQFKVNGKIIMLERGQLSVSVRQIADACGCSKSAVDRYMTQLEIGTMIKRDAGHGKNIITICNYDKYQASPDDEWDTSGTGRGTRAGHKRDTKEERKKVKKEEIPPIIPHGVSESVFAEFLDYRANKVKVPLTQRALNGIVREAAKAGWTVEAAMVKTMERDWRAFEAAWVTKGNDNGRTTGGSTADTAQRVREQLGVA